MSRPPWFARVTAVLLGLLAAVAPSSLPLESPSFLTALLLSTVIFGTAGLLLGALWPGAGWRWGLWVVAPGFLFVTLGLITEREVHRFLTDDLPFLACGLIGAALGGLAGARLRAGRGR